LKILLIYAALTASALFWGAGFSVIRYALRFVTPLEFLAGQAVFAAAAQAAWTVAFHRDTPHRLPRPAVAPVLALGLLGHVLLNGLTFLALNYTTATNTALLFGASPMVTGALAAVFLRERFGRPKRLGAPLGFAGVALIITQGQLEDVRVSGAMLGNLLAAGAAIYWSTYTVLTRRITQLVPPGVYTFYILTLGALLPLAATTVVNGRLPFSGAPAQAIAAMAAVGMGTGALAFNFWNWGLERIEANRVGFFSFLEPVFAAGVAVMFLGEPLTVPTVAGGALVLAGIFLATRGERVA
jgi:drug/metabolite transporter (DMT)-like permease